LRILLVEDDETISQPLVEGLQRYGFTVDHVGTGRQALASAGEDMVLLDLGLPDMDGIDVCRELRAASPTIPIIMLTARKTEADRIVGLELGADDYLAKPFSLRELVARIRAVTRRAAHARPDPQPDDPLHLVRVGELAIDTRARHVHLAGRAITLAPKEFNLLATLAADPGAVHSREHILTTVWDEGFFGSTKTLDFHVASLRRKLGHAGWIQTVRGVGFRLAPPPATGE
jgi:DNA-binding response OmpR family regulator